MPARTRSLLRAAIAATVSATALLPGVVPAQAAPAPTLAATSSTAAASLTTASTAATTAPTYGPRAGTGCSGDGTTGKRVQVVYVVSSDAPDRYAQEQSFIQTQLRGVDSIYVASSQVNGMPAGGTSRQVRWVHDASCLPTILHAVVAPWTDSAGVVHRVDTPDPNHWGDTVTGVRNLGSVNGVSLTDPNRKYLLLVDPKPSTASDPICGLSTIPNIDDTRPDASNANNGQGYSRIDYPCWDGSIDPDNGKLDSTITHELTHILGAVLTGAPHATSSGHCTDNADLMCYSDYAGSAATQVCPTSMENLLDCNGDDYFNTAPPSGSWLSTHWNTANSSFLYTPPAPTVGNGTPTFIPGEPMAWAPTASVTSGQGWNLKYAINATTPGGTLCTLDKPSALSSDAGATSNHLLCPATATSATLTSTLTQEDGQSAAVTTKVTAPATTSPVALALTPGATTVLAGSTITLTARVTDPATGSGLYGVPVHLTGTDRSGTTTAVLDGTTDATGTVATTVTVASTSTFTATSDAAGPWQGGTATAAVTAQIPTQVNLDTPTPFVPGGSTVTVTGQLLDTDYAPMAGQEVDLWAHTSAWTQVGSATTANDGTLAIPVTVTAPATYELRFPGAGDYLPSASGDASIAPTQPTALAGSLDTSTVTAGNAVTVTGTLASNGAPVAGRAVALWLRTGSTWAQVGTATTGADGSATFSDAPAASGAYQVRYAGEAQYAASTSPELPVTVLAPTTLTLTAPDQVSYGQGATLTATLTSAGSAVAGQDLQLLDVTTPGSAPVVATATTDTTGTATFAVTADATRSYQVAYPGGDTWAAASSAVGTVHAVRDTTLDATADTSTLPYGGTLTVTGALASTSSGATGPLTGQTVELWGAPAGGTWTRQDTGTTGSDGTVTFGLTPLGSTSYQLRYPGSAEAAAAIGPTLEVTVTRGTTATLAGPASVAAGGSATLTATLTWTGTTSPLAGQSVQLWAAPTGGAWALAGTAATDASGHAVFTRAVPATTSYQVRYAGNTVLGLYTTVGTTGATRVVTAVRAVAAAVAASTTRTAGGRVTLTGSLAWAGTTTRLAGQPVELWGYSAGRWSRVATGTTSSTGTVAWSMLPTYTTTYQLRYGGNRAIGSVSTAAASSAGVAVHEVARLSLATPTSVRYWGTYTLSGTLYPHIAGASVVLVVNGRIVARTTTNGYSQYTFRYKFPAGYDYVRVVSASNGYADTGSSATYRVHSY